MLNTVSSAGRQPTHATLSPDGKFLLVANYSVAKGAGEVPIGSDGRLGNAYSIIRLRPAPASCRGAGKAGMRTPPPSVAMANTCTRRISVAISCTPTAIVRITRSRCRQMLRDVAFAPGAGPRHMVFSSAGDYAYVITEMAGEIEAFAVNDNRLTRQGKVKLNPAARFGGGKAVGPLP